MMRKPVLTIFYQFKPWNTTVRGIQTLIRVFIKYVPNEFEVGLVGTEDYETKDIGEWQDRKTLFIIHRDIYAKVKAPDDKEVILWQRLPAYFTLENLLLPQFSQILSCNTSATKLYKQHYPNFCYRIVYIKNSLLQVLSRSDDYPSYNCARVACPFTARSVVSEVCAAITDNSIRKLSI